MSDARERRRERDGDDAGAQAERCRRGAHRFLAHWLGPRGAEDADQRVQLACPCGLMGEIVSRPQSLTVLEDPRQELLEHGSMELIGWQRLRVSSTGTTQHPYELRRVLLHAAVVLHDERGARVRLEVRDPLRNTSADALAWASVPARTGLPFVVGGPGSRGGVMVRGRLGSLDFMRLVGGMGVMREAVLDHVTMEAGSFLAMVESMRSTGDGFVFYKLSVGDVRS